MNLTPIHFLGFFGGFRPLPPRPHGTRAQVDDKYRLYAAKLSGVTATKAASRDISERFLLGGVPVVAPPAHFFRAFGALKSQGRSSAQPIHAEAKP
jgi:hypothetical protein